MHSIALISNLAGPEGLLIFLIVLLLFGAKKLPELARGLGQAVKEFSKAKEDVNTEISRATQIPDYSHSHYHADPAHSPAPASAPVPEVHHPAGSIPVSANQTPPTPNTVAPEASKTA
jgi:TatA/E family protein of Tat protein translocase